MSIITNTILQQGKAYNTNQQSAAMDLNYGGQNGYMPEIGILGADGKNYEAWISNQGYVQRNIIPIVIRAPKFFNYMPNPKQFISAYKAMWELHPLTITGFTSGLEVEVDEHPVGGAGEQQEEPSNVTRARTAINTTFKERANKSFTRFLDYLIRYSIMDPDTKKPLVATLINNISDVGGLYTADFYSGTVLFIEPDVTQKTVVDAWLSTNLFPKGTGEREGKRDIHSAGEGLELSIDWASITMNNEAVFSLAQNLLNKLTILNSIPDVGMVVPQREIDSAIAASDVGFNNR